MPKMTAGMLEINPVTARDKWKGRFDFALVSIGYAVGLGNIWRFPYMAYESGGGAFLIPYAIMLVLCGIPLLYMEVAIGQYTQQGPVGAIAKICPLFKGAGLATVVITFLFLTYYNIVITWAFYYMFASFEYPLPWIGCNHTWNSWNCWDGAKNLLNGTNVTYGLNVTGGGYEVNSTAIVSPFGNDSVSPTEDYYNRIVLDRTDGIENLGEVRWQLALILLLTWVLVYFCVFKGTQSTGKVVYFTATFPYVMLIVMLVRGVTLVGSFKGVWFFINPRWETLLDIKVWLNAAIQNFHSVGIAFGGHIAMSSYNKFNNSITRDVLTVSIVNALTSLLSGFVIFSILGHVAYTQGKEVDDVAADGVSLVFVVYPAAFASMPAANFFAVTFFFMLILLGIDSVFASVEVIVTTIQDHFGDSVQKYLKRKELLVLIVSAVTYLAGLPYVTQGGVYVFRLLDYYSATLSLFCLAFLEVISVTWIYGANRLSENIEEMTGKRPGWYLIVCWYGVSPVIILAIWGFSFAQFSTMTLGSYTYPTHAVAVGWMIASLSLICIPLGMIHTFIKARGNTLYEKLKYSLRSPLAVHTFNPTEVIKLNDSSTYKKSKELDR